MPPLAQEFAQLTLITPILILAISSLGLLMVGAFTNNAKLVSVLTALSFVAAALPWGMHPVSAGVFPTPTGNLLQLSPFSLLASQLLLGLAVLATLLPASYLADRKSHKPEYYILTVLSVTGMLILVNSADFLSLYLGLELMSFAIYILVAFLRHDAKSSEAGLKYFVLGGLASGLMLYGISLLYAAAGTTGFLALHTTLADPDLLSQPVVLVGLALTLTGALFKLSAAPFHMWTPDVYEGAPTPVTAFMSVLPKLAAGVVLIRLLNIPFAALTEYWQPLLAAMAVLSMVAGSIMAILQSNLKRLLAWSTIANIGFILVGVVAPTAGGFAGVLVYLVIYGLTTLAIFSALLATGSETTADLKGMGNKHPVLATALATSLFSLAGIPPLAGFMAKFGVFTAAVGAGFTWLAVVGVLCSAIACFYSLWLIKLIAFDTPADESATAAPQASLAVLAVLLAGGLLLLGIVPGILTTLAIPAATALF